MGLMKLYKSDLSKIKHFYIPGLENAQSHLIVNDLTQQRELLLATLQHPVSKQYPPSSRYRKQFLKLLIQQIEESGNEVLEDFYTEYTALLNEKESEMCYKTYVLPQGISINLQETTNLISDGTTGLCTWQAAQCLTEWILEESDLFKDKCVMELGSGLGLTGIAVCKQCHPSRFIFSDCHAKVLALLKQNIINNLSIRNSSNTMDSSPSPDLPPETNPECELILDQVGTADAIESSVKDVTEEEYWSEKKVGEVSIFTNTHLVSTEVWQLDWESVKDITVAELTKDVNLLIAADVVYDESILPALVGVIKNILHMGHAREAYIASTIRNRQTRDKFIQALEKSGIVWQMVDTPKTVFYYDRSVPIEILKMWPLSFDR